MDMRSKSYTYEFATRADGRWRSSWHQAHPFHRSPKEIARAIIERWIIDRDRGLPAGRVVVCGRHRAGVPYESALVRVRVYETCLSDAEVTPAATAYLAILDETWLGAA